MFKFLRSCFFTSLEFERILNWLRDNTNDRMSDMPVFSSKPYMVEEKYRFNYLSETGSITITKSGDLMFAEVNFDHPHNARNTELLGKKVAEHFQVMHPITFHGVNIVYQPNN